MPTSTHISVSNRSLKSKCCFFFTVETFPFCRVTNLLLDIYQNHNYTDCLIKPSPDIILAMPVLFIWLHVRSTVTHVWTILAGGKKPHLDEIKNESEAFWQQIFLLFRGLRWENEVQKKISVEWLFLGHFGLSWTGKYWKAFWKIWLWGLLCNSQSRRGTDK